MKELLPLLQGKALDMNDLIQVDRVSEMQPLKKGP